MDDENDGVQALRETMRSLWSDLNTGPASSNDTIMLEDNFFSIYLRGFPEDYSAQKIHEELELNMKKIPNYLGNGITSVQINNTKKICIVRFANEDVYQLFKKEYDNFVIGGRIVLYASWYKEPEIIHNFGENIRAFLGNVVIHGTVDLPKIKKKYPNIIHTNQTQTGFTIITFRTYDDALNFVLSTKNKCDATILNFPPPQAEQSEKSNLPKNSVTVLDLSNCYSKTDLDKLRKKRDSFKGSDLKLSMIFDPNVNLAKPIDSDSLPAFQLNTLNIYNVVNKSLLSNNNVLEVIAKDMLEYGEFFGTVTNIDIKKPQFDFQNFGVISITFETASAAQNCQKDMAGRFYLGNICITQLS